MPTYPYNRKLVKNAQFLRRHMTEQEKRLWYVFLKKLPITVNRQKNIGDYIVDFYIFKEKLVIELDGIQHTEPEHMQKDIERDAELARLGITVLRYTNKQIEESFTPVCEDILSHLGMSMDDLKQ